MLVFYLLTFLLPPWQSLFNGENLEGWVVKAHPKDQAYTYWKVENGVLTANSLERPDHDYIWLMTEQEFQDFILEFQFRPYTDSPGNSGVQIRSRYDDQAFWLDGPQIDIHPPGHWRTGMMWDETRGNKRWIFPDLSREEWVDSTMVLNRPAFYFAGQAKEWNKMRIIARGNHIQAFLNGKKITDLDGENILDDKIHQRYQVGQKGHIALQIHSNDALKIQFRDIRIKPLPAE